MPTVNQTHNLIINGVGYVTEPNSQRTVRSNPFTDRVSTGELSYSDLTQWSVRTVNDWTHGFGQEYEKDPQMYYESDGIDTTIPGMMQLASQVSISDASFVARVFCDFGDYVFAGGNSSIRYYYPVSDTWANAGTALGAAVTDLGVHANVLFACLGDSVDMQKCAAGTAPTSWTVMTGVQGSYITTWKTKLWRSKANNLYSSSDAGVTWGSAVPVGDSGTNITGLEVIGDYMIVGKSDRSYITTDGTNFPELITGIPNYSSNFKRMKEWQGYVFAPLRQQVIQIGGIGSTATLSDRTPKLPGTDARLLYGVGECVGLTRGNKDLLFAIFDLAENSYPLATAWNGLGWHPIYKGTAGATAYGIYYSKVASALFINDGSTRKKKYLSNDMNAADYPTTGTQYLLLSLDNGGFADIQKSWYKVEIETENCSATKTVTLSFQHDKSGSFTAFPDTVNTSPQQSVLFSANGSTTGKLSQIKLVLATNSGTVTPRVKRMTVYRMVRPPIQFVTTADIRIADDMVLMDGTKETNTAEQLQAALITASNTVTMIDCYTADGYKHTGVLANLSFAESLRREDN